MGQGLCYTLSTSRLFSEQVCETQLFLPTSQEGSSIEQLPRLEPGIKLQQHPPEPVSLTISQHGPMYEPVARTIMSPTTPTVTSRQSSSASSKFRFPPWFCSHGLPGPCLPPLLSILTSRLLVQAAHFLSVPHCSFISLPT